MNMEIINKCKSWQAIPMELIYDSELSLMAKAIYMLLAGLPAASEITATQLELLHGISRKTAGKYMLELRDRGWLECISERKDMHKVYVLHGSLAREEFTHARGYSLPTSRVKFTRARGYGLPASDGNTHYNNKNILLNKREREAPAQNSPSCKINTWHGLPFAEGLTYKEKVACLIDGVDRYVQQGGITPDQAKAFVQYWSEPMVYDANLLKLECERSWSMSARIESWMRKVEKYG